MSLFSVTMMPLLLPMSMSDEPSSATVLFDDRMPFTAYPCVLFPPQPKPSDEIAASRISCGLTLGARADVAEVNRDPRQDAARGICHGSAHRRVDAALCERRGSK